MTLANPGTLGGTANQSLVLNFNHPCKEFIWTAKLGAFNGSSVAWFLAYTNKDGEANWDVAKQDAANALASAMVSVEAASPWTATDASVSEVSFNPASDPISTQVIDGTTWKFVCVNTTNLVADDEQTVFILKNPITLGTINLAAGLVDVTVELDFQDEEFPLPDGCPTVTVTVAEHTLSLVNLSVPVVSGFSTVVTDRRLTADKSNDIRVVMPHNYGLTLDGKGNLVSQCNIVLNSHDRFQKREGNYFNYVQPHQHHSRTPCDGINVYSFALHPEQHQPTGSANMSRIDNTRLNFISVDSERPNSTSFAPLHYTMNTELWVFAINYNVLRIMSGMGGLAYSN